jgi:glycosyltransferase involved in cell wall biosynthesis
MVAFETAVKMKADGHLVTTICPPGSPLQNKLEQAGLKTLGATRKNKYFSPNVIGIIRAALKTGAYSSVLVQQMNDLWQVVPAIWGMRQVKLVAISHTLVGVSKRDILHSLIYSRLNHLVALTDVHKQNLLKALPVAAETIVILPNTIDLEKFNAKKRSEAFRNEFLTAPNQVLIGVVSRLDIGKGLVETVRSAALLKAWHVPFKMVIVGKETAGESGMKATLEDEIRRLNLRDQVTLAGHRSDIETVIASFDILLMPSPSETFGRVLIEAMGCEVAIVASSGGGVTNIIEHEVNGLLVTPLDVDQMAESLRLLCDRSDKRQRLALNGLKSAENFYNYRKVDQQLYGMLGLQ